jgi:hypothetical protein
LQLKAEFALNDLFNQDANLSAREIRSQAEMPSMPERQMIIGFSAYIESIRIDEFLFIAIRRGVAHYDPLAALDSLAANLGVSHRRSSKIDGRRFPPEHLFHREW